MDQFAFFHRTIQKKYRVLSLTEHYTQCGEKSRSDEIFLILHDYNDHEIDE